MVSCWMGAIYPVWRNATVFWSHKGSNHWETHPEKHWKKKIRNFIKNFCKKTTSDVGWKAWNNGETVVPGLFLCLKMGDLSRHRAPWCIREGQSMMGSQTGKRLFVKIITSSGKPDTTMADKFIDNRTYVRYTIFIATIGFKSRQTVQRKIKQLPTVSLTFPFGWPLAGGEKICRKCMWLVHVVKIKGCLTRIRRQ